MILELTGIQQTSEVPTLALLAEGIALLVFAYLSLNLAFKWRSNRRDATLNLFLSFLFYLLAVTFLFSTKLTNYLTSDAIDVSSLGINLGYVFSLVGNIFLYYFTEDIFFDDETRIKYLREVVTFANGITTGFLMIFIFQIQELPFIEIPGEYISPHLLIWHVIVSSFGFIILLWKSAQAIRQASTRLAKTGFFFIGLTAVLEILVFVFFFLDRFAGGSYTYWYFVGWMSASLAGLSGMIGYLMPNWFKRIFG